MKHHINLYGAEFRPKRLWASLNQMALVWGGCLLLLVAATFSMAMSQLRVAWGVLAPHASTT